MGQTNWLSELGRFFLVLLLQVLLLNHIRLFGYINPYFYIYFIILYPLTGNRTLLILLSFLLGFGVDYSAIREEFMLLRQFSLAGPARFF